MPAEGGFSGEQLRFHRERLGMNRRELAERLQVSADMVRQYETRGKAPSLETFIRMAKVLDVPLDELLQEDRRHNR